METTTCLFCGQHDSRSLLRRQEPSHVVCRKCGLVYQNPRPTLEEIGAYYEEGYWEKRGYAEIRDQARLPISLERGKIITEWMKGRLQPSDLILEVGCGHGEIVSYVRDQFGCAAIGVEPSRSQAVAAFERFGLEMQQTGIEGVDLGGRRAKLVILSHVVEHFHDPVASLRRCSELMVDDGWMFIEVPNILNPHPRKRLSIWLALEHMYYFSVASLSRVATAAGLRVVRTEDAEFVRILVQKSTAGVPNGQSAPVNEYSQVLKALRRHELQYWPRYVLKRVSGGLLG